MEVIKLKKDIWVKIETLEEKSQGMCSPLRVISTTPLNWSLIGRGKSPSTTKKKFQFKFKKIFFFFHFSLAMATRGRKNNKIYLNQFIFMPQQWEKFAFAEIKQSLFMKEKSEEKDDKKEWKHINHPINRN